MANNILNARIKLKYDTLQNWTDVEGTFIPLAGEVILYYIPSQDTGHGMTRPCVAMKVGDGSTPLSQLNWTQAQAADVYIWAKQPSPPLASQLYATKTLANSTTQNTTIEAWLQSLSDDMNSISG